MQQYFPTKKSLNKHPIPSWYQEAKFGIFIHWGLYSIPAFSPRVGKISDAFKLHYDDAIVMTPYTEWYANAIKSPNSPSAQFHCQEYGDATYADFKKTFEQSLENWDADAWAESFAASGAKYVVLVTKHHDGFCLWPTHVPHPHQKNWHTERDIVGELAAAVRRKGLRFGVYYSGGIDWSFKPEPVKTLGDFFGSLPDKEYPAYALAQVRELIARYQPDIIWNDIAWPSTQQELFELFADYYNEIPEGVVNDRWMTPGISTFVLRKKISRKIFDFFAKGYLKINPSAVDGVIFPKVPHCDFRSPEYTRFRDIQTKKWEATRGMSHSFGFHRLDTEADYTPAEDLLADFVDGVAKQGNLLLNVGPNGQAQIPIEQMQRLAFFGAWLEKNSDAIYGAQPWARAEAKTEQNLPVRFTQNNNTVYVIIMAEVDTRSIRIKDCILKGNAFLLGEKNIVTLKHEVGDTVLTFAENIAVFAPVIALEKM